jgi:hypothetical protein
MKKITMLWSHENEMEYVYMTDTISENELSQLFPKGYVSYKYTINNNGTIVKNDYCDSKNGEKWSDLFGKLDYHNGALYLN